MNIERYIGEGIIDQLWTLYNMWMAEEMVMACFKYYILIFTWEN